MESPGCNSSTEMATVENFFEAEPHPFTDMNQSLHWGLHYGAMHAINKGWAKP